MQIDPLATLGAVERFVGRAGETDRQKSTIRGHTMPFDIFDDGGSDEESEVCEKKNSADAPLLVPAGQQSGAASVCPGLYPCFGWLWATLGVTELEYAVSLLGSPGG